MAVAVDMDDMERIYSRSSYTPPCCRKGIDGKAHRPAAHRRGFGRLWWLCSAPAFHGKQARVRGIDVSTVSLPPWYVQRCKHLTSSCSCPSIKDDLLLGMTLNILILDERTHQITGPIVNLRCITVRKLLTYIHYYAGTFIFGSSNIIFGLPVCYELWIYGDMFTRRKLRVK